MMQRAPEDRPGMPASPSDRDILQRISTYHPAIKDVEGKHELAALVRQDGI